MLEVLHLAGAGEAQVLHQAGCRVYVVWTLNMLPIHFLHRVVYNKLDSEIFRIYFIAGLKVIA